MDKKPRIVPGRHSVFEVLKVRPESVSKVFFDGKEKKWTSDLKEVCRKHSIPIINKKESFFNDLCQNSQGIACESTGGPQWPSHEREQLFILGLDGIEDPHNLGAIVRTAWLLGVHGILVPQRQSAFLTSTALKIASGGAEHVPLKRVNNLKTEIESLKNDFGFWVYGLCLGSGAQKLDKVKKSDKTILVAGAEEKGIRPGIESSLDFRVTIPQEDSDASFNVSVALGIAMWGLR